MLLQICSYSFFLIWIWSKRRQRSEKGKKGKRKLSIPQTLIIPQVLVQPGMRQPIALELRWFFGERWRNGFVNVYGVSLGKG